MSKKRRSNPWRRIADRLADALQRGQRPWMKQAADALRCYDKLKGTKP